MKTLIITEKPKVSKRIAQVLSSKYSKKSEGGVPYYEVKEDGDVTYIASAAGHLYSVGQKSDERGYPVFDVEWVPLYKIDRTKGYVGRYIRLLSKLAKEADAFVIATDWDIEGELLGYNALKFSCRREDAKRMHFSTLTKMELINAYKNPADIDRGLVSAGEARHIMDWYWGINTSRALSHAAQNVGKRATISAGRVQTPALSILVQREREIAAFEPEPYWEIFADLKAKRRKFRARHVEGKVFGEERSKEIVANSRSERGIVDKVERGESRVPPLLPFDLGGLQTEAYKVFGFNPKKTQTIAQSLYEGGYISYPRTSSQKLPPVIGFKRILRDLGRSAKFGPYTKVLLRRDKLKPRQGKKTDPAHPAIYPTGILPKDPNKDEERLYSLVVHRFFAVFGDPLVKEITKVLVKIDKELYGAEGSRTIDEGWAMLYPYAKIKDLVLPELDEGEIVAVLKLYSAQRETQPPKRYNPASLINELERRGLGTKATRAEIVDTLYQRNYVMGVPMNVTGLGTSVVEALEKYVPEIISEELTRRFEEKIEGIQNGKEDKEAILGDARDELLKILEEFKENDEKIGAVLKDALEEMERKRFVVGKCPKCGGDLRIIQSKKTKKIFIGCTNYPECSTSYPLPQRRGIRTTDKTCNTCGLPMVSVPMGRRRILSCIDMNCPSKRRRR